MKKNILLLMAFLSLFSIAVSAKADTVVLNKVTPYSTAYGDGGISKIEIHDNRTRAWWYALPYTDSSYVFSGQVIVTLTNGKTLYYPVGGNGGPGRSVSGSIYVRGKIRKVSLSGIAFGPGGIQIAIPQSETHNFGGGGSGMNLPDTGILYNY